MIKLRRIALIFIIIFSVSNSFACDICGCSSGNYFIGTFPLFRKHFMGLRYTFRSFRSRLATDNTQFSNDFYQTTEIWGGFNVGRKWQIIGFIPYNINKQISDDGVQQNSGLGDITLIANYKLFDKRNGNKHGKMVSQQLWIGGGLKLPTGKFNVAAAEIIHSANDQAGTGSLDYILNTMYTLHINDWGINSSINYKVNGSANTYRFGNRLSASSFVFHSLSAKKATFNPNAGLLYEELDANRLNRVKVADTGGYTFLASAGLDLIFRKLAVGFNLQAPFAQRLSNDQTNARFRGMAHITMLL